MNQFHVLIYFYKRAATSFTIKIWNSMDDNVAKFDRSTKLIIHGRAKTKTCNV